LSAAGPAVGVLLVTHGKLGHLLLETMSDMLGPLPIACDVLAGVLMLTDAYGSTPANIANKLAIGTPTLVVAGVNLPMLVRVFNYPTLSLDVMARAAVEGGQKGVTLCPRASI